MKSTGKRYNDEFKTDIFRLIRDDKRPVSSIVKNFSASDPTIRNWPKSSKESKDPDKVRITELEAERKETKKKLRRSLPPMRI